VQSGTSRSHKVRYKPTNRRAKLQAADRRPRPHRPQHRQSSTDIFRRNEIDATLANSLDVKKNKPGDRIEARTAQDVKQDGKVVLKKGTRLVGHVTEGQARSKEQAQSQLGIVFDHAFTSDGQEIL